MKIAFGDGIFACNSRDFGIFMPKHLAEQWLLNSYYKKMRIAERIAEVQRTEQSVYDIMSRCQLTQMEETRYG